MIDILNPDLLNTLELFFWANFMLLIYTTAIYPIAVIFISKLYKDRHDQILTILPKITVLVSAYNEEQVIEERIINLLETDYPKELLEIIVGSDGSTDRTNEILAGIKEEHVKVQIFENRVGKPAVLNSMVKDAEGDILVMTDANTHFFKDSLHELVILYGDEVIGGICGKLDLKTVKTDTGEKDYWSFENRIKSAESRIGTLFGANGAIYSIRKSLFTPLPEHEPISDDFMTGINILKQGRKLVYNRNAKAAESLTDNIFDEMNRRARISAKNFTAIKYYYKLLNPANGFISLGLLSHKIFRWISPFFMINLLILSLMLQDIFFYKMFLFGIAAFLGLSLFGIILNLLKIKIKFLTYFSHFFLLNLGLLIGFFKYLFKIQKPYWKTLERSV